MCIRDSISAGGDEQQAFDVQVCQKVLPRIHGSKRDIGDTIRDLAAFCFYGPPDDSKDFKTPDDFKIDGVDSEEAKLSLSFEKLARMSQRLDKTHFVSFAE